MSTIRTFVSNLWEAAQRLVTDAALTRRATEAWLRAQNRRRFSSFEQVEAVRAQRRVLLGLLNQARKTRFGIDHDFRRIHSTEDYRRLVPLTTRADLWRDYWEPALPHVAGATWPALPSAALQTTNIAALRIAMASAAQLRPQLRWLDGRIVWLGEDLALSPEVAHPTPRAKDVFGPTCLPWELRPHTATRIEPRTPVTGIFGSSTRLLQACAEMKRLTGRSCLQDVWPRLAVVFYSRRLTDPDSDALRAEFGDNVLLLEIGVLREGIIAVEDPRYGQLRLLPEQGVYFEFLPAAEANAPKPVRLGLEQIELGVPYELVLTSAAGVWACRAGVSVQFESREPALLRFVETPVLPEVPPTVRQDEPLPAVTAQPPHRRSDDIPVARPESFAHNPWLIPVDRG